MMPKMNMNEMIIEIMMAVGLDIFLLSRKLFIGTSKMASNVANANGIIMSLPKKSARAIKVNISKIMLNL